MSNFNPLSLNNKTFIITGAASGIGRATSVLLAKLGATVVLFDINEQGLEETTKLCQGHIIRKTVDLSNESELETAIKEVVSKAGKINGFAHIAGVPCITPLKAVSLDIAEKVLRINTLPALTLARMLSNRRYMADKTAETSGGGGGFRPNIICLRSGGFKCKRYICNEQIGGSGHYKITCN